MRGCNSTANTATLGGSIYMSRSELLLRKCLFSGDTVSLPATKPCSLSRFRFVIAYRL